MKTKLRVDMTFYSICLEGVSGVYCLLRTLRRNSLRYLYLMGLQGPPRAYIMRTTT